MSNVDIVVQLSTTALTGSTPRKFVPDPVKSLQTYTHTNKAIGGFYSANLSFLVGFSDVNFWYSNGLGMHVQTYNHAAILIWEGFVNKMSVSVGGLSFSLGPLLDVANRVRVDYQTQTWNTNPPIPGMAASTAWSDLDDSQDKYGIFEQIVSGGQCSSNEATLKLQNYLLAQGWPTGDRQIDVSAGEESGSIVVTLECLGYWSILDTYYFSQSASSTENASVKFAAAVAAQPNAIFSTDIAENTSQVGRFEDGSRKALTVIDDLLDARDGSGNQFLAGCRENREVYYEEIADEVLYSISLTDVRRTVRLIRGLSVVYNWDVKAGQFVIVPELTPAGDTSISNTTSAGRIERVFIESATYRLPWQVSITGNKFSGIAGRLSKRGLI